MKRNKLEVKEVVEIASPSGEITTVKKAFCGLIVISSPSIKRQMEESRRNYERLREKNKRTRSTHPWASYDGLGSEQYNHH